MYIDGNCLEMEAKNSPKSVIPGTGGVRKLRFGSAGGGKRGGVRVAYY